MTTNPRASDTASWAHHGLSDRVVGLLVLAWLLLCPPTAQASLLSPELEDKMADFLAIFVMFVVPVVGIVVFWLLHVMPEKIAHKRHHPQFEAIRTLCLLSLAFGGLLWPIAWLWAYTKPVGYKMAYGTDKHPDYYEEAPSSTTEALDDLRERVALLEQTGVAEPISRRCAPISTALESRQMPAGGEASNGNPPARHLLLLRLADLHQVQAAAVDDAVEGHRRDLPGRRRLRPCCCCSTSSRPRPPTSASSSTSCRSSRRSGDG